MRVTGPRGAGTGLCWVKGEELYQIYVAPQARGTGAAVALVADAEARLRDAGVGMAWLACAIGNDRAARFYEKSGWRRTGVVPGRLDVPGGTFAMEVWRYEKEL